MKNTKVFSILTAVTGLLALPSASMAVWDYEFNVAGFVSGEGYIVNASVKVDFSLAGAGLVTVNVTNLGPTESRITGFYLRKPFDDGGNVDTSNLSLFNTGAYGGGSTLDPVDWWIADDNDFQPLVNYGDFVADPADYFGADTKEEGETEGTSLWYPGDPSSGTFVFSFDGQDLTEFDWYTEDAPMVYVRWQTVGDNLSAKGYGGGPGWEPAVPEPSAVAAMAIFGLGGILLMRRRLTRKS